MAADKNELLFSLFGINYNNEPVLFRKGTILLRKLSKSPSDEKLRQVVLAVSEDMIRDKFWQENSEILGLKSPKVHNTTEVRESAGSAAVRTETEKV